MKKNVFIALLVLIFLVIGGNLIWQNKIDKEKEKVYILYDSDEDEKINWSEFQHLFPADFDPNKTRVEIGEVSKLDENQRKIFDSIKAEYYSKLHLVKEKNGNNFYLTINPNEAILFEKIRKVKQISNEEIAGYPIIALDSLITIIPGLEYFQLKNSEKMEFLEHPNFHIIEPVPGYGTFNIFQVQPTVESYD